MIKLIGVLFTLSVAGAVEASAAQSLAERIDRYVAPLQALDVFSGVILVARGDTILTERAYGYANLELGIAMRPDHVFRIASISKSFTRGLIGRMVDRGAIGLDEPIGRWLPELPWGDQVTVRMLLDHRAGVPDRNSIPYDEEAIAHNTLDLLLDTIGARPLDFTPGAHQRYSNGGYAVLARLVERVEGHAFAEVLQQEIAKPLDLAVTRHEADGDVILNRAAGYMPSPLVPGSLMHAPFQEMRTKTGGGSLVSNTRDLLAWTLAIKNGSLLSPGTSRELFPVKNGQLFWQGRSPGYNAAVLHDASTNVTTIVLANNYAAGMTADIVTALQEMAAGREPKPLPVRPPPAAHGNLARFEGTYQLDPGGPVSEVDVRVFAGNLVAYVEGTPVEVLLPQSGDAFLARALWSLIRFEGTQGAASSLVMKPLYRDAELRGRRIRSVAPDSIELEEQEIYLATLRFFSPPRNQMRWIDTANVGARTASYLAGRLGKRFAPATARRGGDGGMLELRRIVRVGVDSARVRIRYRHMTDHYDGEPIDVDFLVARRNGAWRATREN